MSKSNGEVVSVRIIPNEKGNPPGKLADAEVIFEPEAGPLLSGLKLIGFSVWERRSGGGRNVTFPARQYSVNGERRSFALLRPATGDTSAQEAIRDAVLEAYTRFEAQVYALRPEEGGRHKPCFSGYRPQFFFRTTDVNGELQLSDGSEMVMPGDTAVMTIELGKPIAMDEGLGFAVREGGKTVAAGTVTKLLD